MAITCRHCHHQGFLRRYLICELNKEVYVCDECEGMYFRREDLNNLAPNVGTSYPTWIEKQGFKYGAVKRVPVGNWWLIWFDKKKQKYAGRMKLDKLKYEEVAHIRNLDFVNPHMLVNGVLVLTLEKLQWLQAKYRDILIEFDKYIYFLEFEDEYEGHISAETQNYIKDFAPQIKTKLGEDYTGLE